jgi:hypothetical protein
MTRDEVGKLLAMLHAAWPGAPAGDPGAQVRAFELALSDLPYSAGEQAVATWIRTSRFFPAPAELREMALNVLGVAPSPEDAWAEVVEQMRRVGSYGSPSFSNPVVADAVRRIGWRSLCTSEDLAADRAWFCRTYEVLRRRHVAQPLALEPAGAIGRLTGGEAQ